MLLRTLVDVRHLFHDLEGTFLGVGMTAYSRIIPGYYLQPYHIITCRKTRDLPFLRRRDKIFCLEEETGQFLGESGFNSTKLLSHPLVKRYLKELPDPKYLLLYQGYSQLELLAEREGWFLLANPSSLRLKLAERSFFNEMVEGLNLPGIPGHIYPIRDIFHYDYDQWAQKTTPAFVVRLLDIKQGGGRGTFFIKSKVDYRRLQDKLREGTWRGMKLKRVSIHEFKDGIPVSLALCLTRHGILFSSLQRQLIDLPYCRDLSEDGVFCGHAWGKTGWPPSIKDEAKRQALLMGEYLMGLGYKGILGIDFLITRDKKDIYPLECNPRLTGAFPMLSQLHMGHNLIPMDVFHMLEFMDVSYEIDLVSMNSRYEEIIWGSHLIMFTLSDEVRVRGESPLSGLYKLDPESGRIHFLGGGCDYTHIRDENQFIIIDGPPATGQKGMIFRDSLHRLCRILFPQPIIDEQDNISARALFVADWVKERTVL